MLPEVRQDAYSSSTIQMSGCSASDFVGYIRLICRTLLSDITQGTENQREFLASKCKVCTQAKNCDLSVIEGTGVIKITVFNPLDRRGDL